MIKTLYKSFTPHSYFAARAYSNYTDPHRFGEMTTKVKIHETAEKVIGYTIREDSARRHIEKMGINRFSAAILSAKEIGMITSVALLSNAAGLLTAATIQEWIRIYQIMYLNAFGNGNTDIQELFELVRGISSIYVWLSVSVHTMLKFRPLENTDKKKYDLARIELDQEKKGLRFYRIQLQDLVIETAEPKIFPEFE